VKSAANDFGGDGGASRLMSRIALGRRAPPCRAAAWEIVAAEPRRRPALGFAAVARSTATAAAPAILAGA